MSAELTPPSGAEIVPTDQTLLSPPTRAGDPSVEDPSIEVEPIDGIGIHGQPEPGEVLFGRYLVERQLGEGGMGTVWLVRHLELDAPRALKLIVSGIAFDPQARARFKREARVMALLSHPHAVAVHDARMAKDAAFIEMEYVKGQSLNKLLKAGVPMPLDWTARLLEQLCDVLQEAHALKIVHRDLKPANLMLVEGRPRGKEQLKVLDFGIAKILEGDLTSGDCRTNTGCFMGSAPWSSPEQASDAPIDGRSDLYSVGVILYEFLTGHRPFSGPITRVLYSHLYTPPPTFIERNPNVVVPPEVERVVLRCLAKNPDDRPQTARELSEEFLAAFSGKLVVSPGAEFPDPSQPDATRLAGSSQLPTPVGPATTEKGSGLAASPGASGLSQVAATEPARGADPPAAPRVAQGAVAEPEPLSSPVYETPFPARPGKAAPPRRSRRWAAVFVMMIVIASLAAAALYLGPFGGPSHSLPEGYKAESSRDLVNGWPRVLVREGDKTRFIRIEGGRFDMGNDFDTSGSETDEDVPAHPVILSDYYLQETEVTNGELEAYFQATKLPPEARPKRWQKAWDDLEKESRDPRHYPAVGISHELAEQYAEWVSGRLPTEAQWEYAARSQGRKNLYVWGNDPKPSPKLANIDTVGLIGSIKTCAVREYVRDRTAQGIYGMTGNVREWCRDVWEEYQDSNEPQTDPQGPKPPAGHVQYVIRGGSFITFADKFRTTRPRRPETADVTERQLAEDGTAEDLGFRVVIEWPRDSK